MTRALAVIALAGLLAGCAGRQVEVGTGPESAQASESAVSLRVTNNLPQAVNVYVVDGTREIFVRQVPGRGTETFQVGGVTAGTSVTLRARQVDRRQVYERNNVTLQAGVFEWQVP